MVDIWRIHWLAGLVAFRIHICIFPTTHRLLFAFIFRSLLRRNYDDFDTCNIWDTD